MCRLTLCLILAAVLGGCESVADPADLADGSRDAAELAAASGAVDLSRLDPPLSTNFNWRCHLEAGSQPVCIGQGPFYRQYRWMGSDRVRRGVRWRQTHLSQPVGERHRRAPLRRRLPLDGSPGSLDRARALQPRARRLRQDCERRVQLLRGFVYGVPADDGTITETIRGTDPRPATDQPPHKLVFLNKGEVRFTPDGKLEVLSGRWDFVDDFEGAVQRLCGALQ